MGPVSETDTIQESSGDKRKTGTGYVPQAHVQRKSRLVLEEDQVLRGWKLLMGCGNRRILGT